MKKLKSVTSHALGPPHPVTNCYTFADPLPLESVRTFWTSPKEALASCTKLHKLFS